MKPCQEVLLGIGKTSTILHVFSKQVFEGSGKFFLGHNTEQLTDMIWCLPSNCQSNVSSHTLALEIYNHITGLPL